MTAHERVRALVLEHGRNATCYQVLNPGFSYWISPDGNAAVAYAARHGVRVAAGEPICDAGRATAAVRAFETDAARAGFDVAWFGVETPGLASWQDTDAAQFSIGAQPVWTAASLAAVMHTHASLRAQLNRAANKGVRATTSGTANASASAGRANASAAAGSSISLEAKLRDCLHDWLDRRGLPPLHFLVEPDTLTNLADRRVVVAYRSGAMQDVVGFLVLSPIPARNGWLVEQIVRCGTAPNGTAEALLECAARSLAREGADMITLGLSALSRRGQPVAPAPRLVRILFKWVRAHGRRFYNFEGLDAFKAKFRPDGWESVHMVVPDGSHVLKSLIATGAVFGGSSAASFTTRVMSHALQQELRRLRV